MKNQNRYAIAFAIVAVLHFAFTNHTHAQSWSTLGNTLIGGEKLGGSSGFFPVDFYINNVNKMSLTTNGDLNLVSGTNAYMIGSQGIVQHNGNSSNIFVGYLAGSSNGNLVSYNTYMGNSAGFSGTGSSSSPDNRKNTFMGVGAGYNNLSNNHTFIGFQAGYSQNSSLISGNTFVGSQAGYNNLGSDESVFVGYQAGYNITNASGNTFVGYYSGQNAQTISGSYPYSNTCLGAASGRNFTTGAYNVFIGNSTGMGASGSSTGSSNTGIGTFAFSLLTTGYANIAAGAGTMYSNTTGSRNTAMGDSALFTNTTTHFNNAIGYKALYTNSASNNNAHGHLALYSNSTGYANVAIGSSAAYSGTTGSRNISIGDSAQFSNTTQNFNTVVGYQALGTNNNGSFNCAFGHQALSKSYTDGVNDAFGYNSLRSNTLGSSNSAFGYLSLTANTTGGDNVAVGHMALTSNLIGGANVAVGSGALPSSTGNDNVAIGQGAGFAVTTGTDNTLIGYATNVGSGGLTKAAAIGSSAVVSTSNTMILGDNTVNVGIGYSGSALTSNTKFDVLTTGATISSSTSSYASHNINTNIGSGSGLPAVTPLIIGVYGESSGAGNAFTYNYGGAFKGSNAGYCVGVSVISIGTGSSNRSYGGSFNSTFSAASSGASYGVYSSVGSNGASNIALYATAPSSVGNTVPNWAGYFVNDVYINGNGWINTAWTVSDKQFKTNIDTIKNPTTILKKLKPQSFYYDTANTVGMNLSNKKQYGFIAQDVQQVLPELVCSVTRPAIVDTAGKVLHPALSHLGVNYTAFIALLTSVVQAQQSKVDSLNTKTNKQDSIIAKQDSILAKQDSILAKQDSINKSLQNQINQIINNCCNSGSSNRTMQPSNGNGNNNNTIGNTPDSISFKIAAISVQLSNADAVVLNQNVPNPFAEQTVITYSIPQNTGTAMLLFYDVNGRQIQTVNITAKGAGQLSVYANDLTNGMYSYTLVVDGKIIDTKRMVKQQ